MRTKFGFFRSPHMISLSPTLESEWVSCRDLRLRWEAERASVRLLPDELLEPFPFLFGVVNLECLDDDSPFPEEELPQEELESVLRLDDPQRDASWEGTRSCCFFCCCWVGD